MAPPPTTPPVASVSVEGQGDDFFREDAESEEGSEKPAEPVDAMPTDKQEWPSPFLAIVGIALGCCIMPGLGFFVGWLVFAPSGEEVANYDEVEELPVVVPPGEAELNGSVAPAEVELAEAPAASAPSPVEEPHEVWICDRSDIKPQYISGSEAEKTLVMSCGATMWQCLWRPAGAEITKADCVKVSDD